MIGIIDPFDGALHVSAEYGERTVRPRSVRPLCWCRMYKASSRSVADEEAAARAVLASHRPGSTGLGLYDQGRILRDFFWGVA